MTATWTERAALNRAWAHFVDGNGGPSTRTVEGESIRCQYRGDGGARCAVGLLIDDADYVPTMESLTVGTLIRTHALPTLSALSASFLGALQRAHDEATHAEDSDAFRRAVRAKLTALARDFRLPVPGTDEREWVAELLYCAEACIRVPAEIGGEHLVAYLKTQAVRADREQPAAANVLWNAALVWVQDPPRAADMLRTLAHRFLAD